MRRCFLACLLLRLPGRLLLDCFGPLRWLFLLYPRRGGTGRLLGRVRLHLVCSPGGNKAL